MQRLFAVSAAEEIRRVGQVLSRGGRYQCRGLLHRLCSQVTWVIAARVYRFYSLKFANRNHFHFVGAAGSGEVPFGNQHTVSVGQFSAAFQAVNSLVNGGKSDEV